MVEHCCEQDPVAKVPAQLWLCGTLFFDHLHLHSVWTEAQSPTTCLPPTFSWVLQSVNDDGGA